MGLPTVTGVSSPALERTRTGAARPRRERPPRSCTRRTRPLRGPRQKRETSVSGVATTGAGVLHWSQSKSHRRCSASRLRPSRRRPVLPTGPPRWTCSPISARGLRGPGRKYGTPVSGWQQQLVSQLVGGNSCRNPGPRTFLDLLLREPACPNRFATITALTIGLATQRQLHHPGGAHHHRSDQSVQTAQLDLVSAASSAPAAAPPASSSGAARLSRRSAATAQPAARRLPPSHRRCGELADSPLRCAVGENSTMIAGHKALKMPKLARPRHRYRTLARSKNWMSVKFQIQFLDVL